MTRIARTMALSVLVGFNWPCNAQVQQGVGGASVPVVVQQQAPLQRFIPLACVVFPEDTKKPSQNMLADADAAEKRGDYVQAVSILLARAQAGYAEAQFRLGVAYCVGQGVQQDYKQAESWYLRAAKQGEIGAQFALGALYSEGVGVAKDDKTAMLWYSLAAKNGDAEAQSILGDWYSKGRAVPKDYKTAANWYRAAAKQGEAYAQLMLGQFYEDGRGVPKDYGAAANWYRRAAEQGQQWSQFALGLLYDEGRGVLKDYKTAAYWYRRAAEQGYDRAQNNLGVLYQYGLGVPKDFIEAYMWLNLAATSSDASVANKAAYTRGALEAVMTPEQIAEAQQLSAQWQPKSEWKVAAQSDNSAPAEQSAGSQDGNAGATPPAPTKTPDQRSVPHQKSAEALVGSGFYVSQDGRVVTNAHVVERCKDIHIWAAAGVGTGRILARDSANDLALLATTLHPTVIAPRRSSVHQGEDVAIYGYPLVGLLADGGGITTGTVAALTGLGDDSRLLQITAPVQPGNSGGPVLDRSGNIVGIVVAKLDALGIARVTHDIPENVGFAIKGSVLNSFLEIWPDISKPEAATTPLSTPDIAAKARAFTVRIECSRQ